MASHRAISQVALQQEYEIPGAGRGSPRRPWLRNNSAGAFTVHVLPANTAGGQPATGPCI